MSLYISRCFFVPNLLGVKSHLLLQSYIEFHMLQHHCVLGANHTWLRPHHSEVDAFLHLSQRIISWLVLYMLGRVQPGLNGDYRIHFCCGNSALNQQTNCLFWTYLPTSSSHFETNRHWTDNNIRNAVWLLLLRIMMPTIATIWTIAKTKTMMML